MRIRHIVTAFPRFPNDIISPWLVEMLKRLRAAGYDVEVLAPAYRGGGNREFGGIPVHRFRYFPARWEDLTHDQATLDRFAVRCATRSCRCSTCWAVSGRRGGCAAAGAMTSSTSTG